MNERTTSTDMVVAGIAWTVVVLLLTSGWLLLGAGNWQVGLMLGLTACAASAFAAVRHIRCYTVRLCALVRNCAGLVDSQDGASLHSLR